MLIAVAVACGGTDRRSGNFVNMYDNAFNAAVVRVPVGGRVKWINVGKNVHNAVAADESWSTSGGSGPASAHTLPALKASQKPGLPHALG